MGLRERQERKQRTQGHEPLQQQAEHGHVTNAMPFDPPIHALVDGEPVRIAAHGNVAGFSPGYLCVDGEGDSTWVSLKDVKIIDPIFKPFDLATLQRQQYAGATSAR